MMQRKIKAVLRSARRKSLSSHSPRHSYESFEEDSSPRTEQFSTNGRGQVSLEASSSRTWPANSAKDRNLGNGTSIPHLQNTFTDSLAPATDPDDMSTTHDYQSDLSAPATTNNAHPEQDMPLGGNERLVYRGINDCRENDKDRDMSSLEHGRNKPLPEPSGRNEMAQVWPREKSVAVKSSNATSDGDDSDWKVHQAALRDSVLDLRNTVDVDKNTNIAAPIVHEVVKPHQHEVIHREIHREIHNYTYYHRLQPVIHTEVLPPRHFIPNPEGEGLIEIAADELPSRTGQNQWWEIMQKHMPQSYEIQSQWRTEPEVLHGDPYITEEGFERKETTIIYPPTLADMTSYDGVVQPVHFDHKTGEHWLGEVTTMSKLNECDDGNSMVGLAKSPPQVMGPTAIQRKPVGLVT